jgi:ribosomal protein L11 methyltransferase
LTRPTQNPETDRVSDPDGWIAVRVEVPPDAADTVANFLIERGAAGVVTEDGPGGTRLEAPVPAGEHDRLAAALARYLASLRDLDPAFRHCALPPAPVPALDWTAHARAHHRPQLVGRRLLIAPPWDVPHAPGRATIVIDPGMAFGTGQHATTRGCLEAIEEAVEQGPVAAALDVGTGSGILAIALARLGVRRVAAVDLDAAVLPIARANCAANGAAGIELAAADANGVRGWFDVVVANLLAEPLVRAAAALEARTAPHGALILSGLLDTQAPEVMAAYPGWRLAGERRTEGWSTLTLRRG